MCWSVGCANSGLMSSILPSTMSECCSPSITCMEWTLPRESEWAFALSRALVPDAHPEKSENKLSSNGPPSIVVGCCVFRTFGLRQNRIQADRCTELTNHRGSHTCASMCVNILCTFKFVSNLLYRRNLVAVEYCDCYSNSSFRKLLDSNMEYFI
jgi:hypothetical protein